MELDVEVEEEEDNDDDDDDNGFSEGGIVDDVVIIGEVG